MPGRERTGRRREGEHRDEIARWIPVWNRAHSAALEAQVSRAEEILYLEGQAKILRAELAKIDQRLHELTGPSRFE